jgi:hypothetical protein
MVSEVLMMQARAALAVSVLLALPMGGALADDTLSGPITFADSIVDTDGKVLAMGRDGANATSAAFGNLVAALGAASARTALGLGSGDSPAFTGLSLTSRLGIGGSLSSSRIFARGTDATSSNYAAYLDNSLASLVFFARNDGLVYAQSFLVGAAVSAPSNGIGVSGNINTTAGQYQVAGAQIAAANLSNGTSGSGAIALASGPTLSGATLSGATALTGSGQIDSSGHVGLGAAALSAARLFAHGTDATSSNYAVYADNSLGTLTFYARNDGLVYAQSLYVDSGGISAAGTPGVSCSGPPTAGFTAVRGIVTAC